MTGKAAGGTGHNGGRILRPTLKALPADARGHNRSLILRTLFHGGPISRADLSRATGLTRVSISDLVAALIDEGLIEECGHKPQKVGKPGILVRLRADAFHIVALDLSDTDHLRGAVLDLNGTILTRRSASLQGRMGDDAFEAVADLTKELIAATSRPLLGIGVGTPGVVGPDSVVVEAPNLGWFELPLADKLRERFELPAYVANDANTAALAEFTFGCASDSGLVVVTVGRGVGVGIVIDGAQLLGHASAAGELGHVTAVPDGKLCGCGRRGCLETILAAPALRELVAKTDPARVAGELASVGRITGEVFAPVVSAINPAELVLAGPADLLGGPLEDAMLATIKERTMPIIGNDLSIRMARLGEEVTVIGAAALVLSGELGVS